MTFMRGLWSALFAYYSMQPSATSATSEARYRDLSLLFDKRHQFGNEGRRIASASSWRSRIELTAYFDRFFARHSLRGSRLTGFAT
ncbi:hypothetical protein BC827DRAFT_1191004 [Russula dissimulans]|nr:hypothetical protein BC827DRAFT_1191004 [Russula dissimulans]